MTSNFALTRDPFQLVLGTERGTELSLEQAVIRDKPYSSSKQTTELGKQLDALHLGIKNGQYTKALNLLLVNRDKLELPLVEAVLDMMVTASSQDAHKTWIEACAPNLIKAGVLHEKANHIIFDGEVLHLYPHGMRSAIIGDSKECEFACGQDFDIECAHEITGADNGVWRSGFDETTQNRVVRCSGCAAYAAAHPREISDKFPERYLHHNRDWSLSNDFHLRHDFESALRPILETYIQSLHELPSNEEYRRWLLARTRDIMNAHLAKVAYKQTEYLIGKHIDEDDIQVWVDEKFHSSEGFREWAFPTFMEWKSIVSALMPSTCKYNRDPDDYAIICFKERLFEDCEHAVEIAEKY